MLLKTCSDSKIQINSKESMPTKEKILFKQKYLNCTYK